jgi:ketosteroid isomerase-like protein
MSEEATTRDLVELTRRYLETVNRRDFAAVEAFHTADVVLRGELIGVFEGRAAVRGFIEDMIAPYLEFRGEAEPIIDLGFGVAFFVTVAKGRLVGSSADVRFRFASVVLWTEGLVERVTNYMDIDEALAAAQGLADERPSMHSGSAARALEDGFSQDEPGLFRLNRDGRP